MTEIKSILELQNKLVEENNKAKEDIQAVSKELIKFIHAKLQHGEVNYNFEVDSKIMLEAAKGIVSEKHSRLFITKNNIVIIRSDASEHFIQRLNTKAGLFGLKGKAFKSPFIFNGDYEKIVRFSYEIDTDGPTDHC